ncbi:MAG TPA: hypothetical protein VGV37_25075 [Aliidongia sp.]|uniref:hypothetical protein n=1 Tax=Aliidongia sp. TaxID=1914230 RepID=UPI002DDD62D3|nr:hypothetical protein [Aliidongia sp.]HEV2677828.1 hypothetical protein [Aliidongia sp.]
MINPIDPPTLALEIDDLVDWLELTALFNAFGLARLDDLLGSLSELEETAEDNIGEHDRQREQLIERIENEVEKRRYMLGEAYPFELTASGEELLRDDNWRDYKFAFYLICLVTAHVTGSAILRRPPVGELLIRLRNDAFQIIATLGLAGLSEGPAFSVGWPRKNGETIVQLLTRAAAAGGGFSARNPPGPYVSPHEKDGGVDVIAWKAERMPPPTAFYFGQTASGKNWPDKPVAEYARVFAKAYMIDHMTGNLVYVTVIPYRVVNEAFWNTQHLFHMAILDRLRLPLRAWQGAQLAAQGVLIDDADRLGDLIQWLEDFVTYAQAA